MPGPPPKDLHPSQLRVIPLTDEEHLMIINPPHIALQLVRDGTAVRKSIWDLWVRCRVGLRSAERAAPHVAGQVRAVVLELENYFLAQPTSKESGFVLSKDLVLKISDVLEIADQLQRELSRAYLLVDFRWVQAYCLHYLEQAERRYAKKLKEEIRQLKDRRSRVAA